MPDLGKYAAEVLGAYGVSLALIGALVWASLRGASRMRAALRDFETRREGRDG